MRKFRAKIEERLAKLKAAGFIPRLPRSLDELKYWKASDVKWFLLAFSLPFLHDIMKDSYLQHHVLLIHTVSLLMFTSVSLKDLEEADKCLHKYVKDFKKLYGEK